MKNNPENINEILSQQISGFHQYCLEAPVQMTYASRNLCRMLGVTTLTAESYLQLVHPADRKAYTAFLARLADGRPEDTLQYRMIKPDGSIISVCDTIHTGRSADGCVMGNSVLANISELKAENKDLRFLNDTVPCGFLKYSCEKQPRITYINDRMLSILRLPVEREGRSELMELYMENIYMLIPLEERRRFSRYLERVSRSGAPLAGEMTVQRGDGSKAHLFGWVAVTHNEKGEPEYQSVCMDISEKYRTKKTAEINRYLNALHDVYDTIFEYDLAAGTVTCIYGENSPTFRPIQRIPMQMQAATEQWARGCIHPDDLERVLAFFSDFFRNRLADGQLSQIRYQAHSSDGQWKHYLGLFLEVDATTSLYCCRNLSHTRESVDLQLENDSLKNINENMQELMMQFTDGIAAFELSGNLVTPLYASDNVCGFFGFSRDEWMKLMQQKTPLLQFVQRCNIPYAEFAKALAQGEAEFTYSDLGSGLIRRIKAVCSQKSARASSRYVMLYDLDRGTQAAGAPSVYIRTFGYFDVFVQGKPIAFRIQKAKELFALLVDRRGGYVSSDEAISYLWPEEASNTVTLARYRKVALRLKNILEEYGIPQVVEAVDGKRRIVTQQVQCDLYDYLSGKPEYAQLFKGSYMNNYSWGETTLGELTCENLYESRTFRT